MPRKFQPSYKTFDYPQAPSGKGKSLSYKEPMMKFEGGFGYLGALLFDAKSDEAQCHLDGKWFTYLPKHLHVEHKLTAAQYREKVGLNRTTRLIGEKMRKKLTSSNLEKRIKNLKTNRKVSEKTKQKIRDAYKTGVRMEHRNRMETCPAQLEERLRDIEKFLGRSPSQAELNTSGIHTSLRKYYGTLGKAKQAAGLKPNPTGIHVQIPKI